MKRVNDSIKAIRDASKPCRWARKQYADLMRDRELVKERFIDLEREAEQGGNRARNGRAQAGRNAGIAGSGFAADRAHGAQASDGDDNGRGVGLIARIVIAGAREMKDTSLKNLKDVRAYTQMAILGSVPLLENDFVVRRRRRLAWLGWTTACLAAAVVMSGLGGLLLRDESLNECRRI